MSETWLLAYMPVYHAGWERLMNENPAIKNIALLAREELMTWSPTHKDIHGLSVTKMQELLRRWRRWKRVEIVDEDWLKEMENEKGEVTLVIAKQEGLLEWVEENFGKKVKVKQQNIFVKWDKKNAVVEKKVEANSVGDEERKLIEQVLLEGEKSSDWWRRVGCVLILSNGERIFTHNTHLPEEQTPYMVGDVRAQFHKGEHIELTSAIHAEALAIATAAKNGWATKGAEMIVSDFPCPVCAKLIAAAGVKKVFFHRGYSMLDGEEILKQAGVVIAQI